VSPRSGRFAVTVNELLTVAQAYQNEATAIRGERQGAWTNIGDEQFGRKREFQLIGESYRQAFNHFQKFLEKFAFHTDDIGKRLSKVADAYKRADETNQRRVDGVVY
jgi:hypothetical protein